MRVLAQDPLLDLHWKHIISDGYVLKFLPLMWGPSRLPKHDVCQPQLRSLRPLSVSEAYCL